MLKKESNLAKFIIKNSGGIKSEKKEVCKEKVTKLPKVGNLRNYIVGNSMRTVVPKSSY